MNMTLEEIKKNLDRYKQPIHRANPTAQNYVDAVETLLMMQINLEADHMGDVEIKPEDRLDLSCNRLPIPE